MVGGNIPGETRTLSVAIYDRMQAFDDRERRRDGGDAPGHRGGHAHRDDGVCRGAWVLVVADAACRSTLRQPGPIPLTSSSPCDPGDVLAIFGPSGSGKTTILRTIAGLYRPAHASVRSGAETWTDTVTGTFAPPHRRAVGFVFQEYALFPHLTAAGNVIDRARASPPRRTPRPGGSAAAPGASVRSDDAATSRVVGRRASASGARESAGS